MTLAIVLLFLSLLIVYILFVPIIVCIDTDTHQYFIQIKGLAKVSLEREKVEIIRLKLKVLYMNFYFYPLKQLWRTKKAKAKKKFNKKKEFQKGIKILKSFKVKQLRLNIDTGDCILNAKLYPFFSFLNYHIGCFNVNFKGRNHLKIELENRPIYIIKSIIN